MYPNRNITKAVFIFLSGLFIQSAWAADTEVSLKFVTYPRWTERKPIEMPIGDGETLKLKVPSNSLSKPYKVPRLEQWVFGQSITDEDGQPIKDARGRPAFEAFGQCAPLTSDEQIILLIRKGDKPSDGIHAIPLNGNLDGFGAGDFFFMNTTKVPIAGIMGETRFLIKPNTHQIVELNSRDLFNKGEHDFVFTKVFFKVNEEVKPLLSTIWPASPKARSMIFFYHDKDSARIRMHTLQDFKQ